VSKVNTNLTSNFNLLNQQVDTLKLHLYPNVKIDEKELNNYKSLLETLKDLKAEAQRIQSNNQDIRFVTHTFADGNKFHIMATTVSGFAVSIKNNDVSISIKNIKKLPAQNPNIKIEFRSSYLTIKGYHKAVKETLSFITNNILQNYSIKVSEIHLCADTQGYNFNMLDIFRLKTRMRTKVAYSDIEENSQMNIFFTGYQFNSFRFGSSNYLLRIYNKTEELKKNRDKNFVKLLKWQSNPYYDEDKPVWRIEFQIRRAKLKQMYSSKNGILDGFEVVLNSIGDIWTRCMSDFTLKDLTDEQVVDMQRGYTTDKKGKTKPLTNYAVKKRFQRANVVQAWEDITNFNGFIPTELHKLKKTDLTDKYYLKNQIKGLFSLFAKTHQDEATPDKLIKIIDDIDKELLIQMDMGLVDYANTKALDHFDNISGVRDWYGIPSDHITRLKVNLISSIKQSLENIYLTPITQTAIQKYESKGVFIPQGV
jgi:hypothetical protein